MRKTLLAAALASAFTAAAAAEHDRLLFSAHPFDTQRDGAMRNMLAATPATGARLQVLQFDGPVRRDWLDHLRARGITPLQYVAHNGYLVWVDDNAAARVRTLSRELPSLQFNEPYHAMFKFDPLLQQRMPSMADAVELDIDLQLYRHPGNQASKRVLRDLAQVPPIARGPLGTGRTSVRWQPVLAYENTRIRVRRGDLDTIAALPDVVWLGHAHEMAPHDEKQNIILAGDPVPSLASQRYLPFLLERGFSDDPEQYPLIDIADTPVHEGGSGVTAVETADPTLRVEGSPDGASRVRYFNNCTAQTTDTLGDTGGHGTINASIVAGYDLRGGAPYQDADGHQLGLGVNPFARIGSTAIFAPGFSITACDDSHTGLIASVARRGAKISNNSWGSTLAPSSYDIGAQQFDIGVRDADPLAPGDQPLIEVFAAGNSGNNPGTVGTPAIAKNVITVGASENLRPFWLDGCGTGTSGADNSGDVIDFSGRGPVPGGATKPEIIAPGTHIQGSASVFAGFDGSSVCDQYYPPAQTVFASSSGTSHAAPAVAGVASLAWWWLERDGFGAIDRVDEASVPSPAMMKAWLMAHPTYLDGVGANDDLPSNAQGYGMPNLDTMFDTRGKVLVDQSHVFADSGDEWNATWSADDGDAPVRIALAWTDAPGLVGTSPQVNDLDLEVTIDGVTYLGNRFSGAWSTTGGTADTLNNYEAVFLPAGVTGAIDIRVRASNIAGNALPNAGDVAQQDFALVCSNCARAPGFALATARAPVQACAGDAIESPVGLRQISGFGAPVTLSASGLPAGSTASFDPNPVAAPAQSVFRLHDTAGAAAGRYDVAVLGSADALSADAILALDLYTTQPAQPPLQLPLDAAADVARTPTFEWQAVAQAHGYLVQIASDARFATIVASTETADTAWTVPRSIALDTNRRFWWRVIARNACGDSASLDGEPPGPDVFADSFEPAAAAKVLPIAESRMFVTEPSAGDCPIDTPTTLLFDDTIDNGDGDWTHGAAGTPDTWRRASEHTVSGDAAWHVDNPPGVGEQWLISPAIVLPAALHTTSLRFMNRQSILAGTLGTCFDGALVEISTNDGGTWQPIDAGQLTDPYDGPVATPWGSPLAGRQAWCGDPQDWLESVVDLQPWAGNAVKLRFRLGNDRYAPSANPAWVIDNVRVSGCPG